MKLLEFHVILVCPTVARQQGALGLNPMAPWPRRMARKKGWGFKIETVRQGGEKMAVLLDAWLSKGLGH